MWVVNKGWMGVLADFHFGPLAYVKMLSLSPSQVLPLQMPELSVLWSPGGWGARGRKSGKISILNKRNFVLQSPDYHSSPFYNVPQLPVSFWLFSPLIPASFSSAPSLHLYRELCFRPELLCQSDELHLSGI